MKRFDTLTAFVTCLCVGSLVIGPEAGAKSKVEVTKKKCVPSDKSGKADRPDKDNELGGDGAICELRRHAQLPMSAQSVLRDLDVDEQEHPDKHNQQRFSDHSNAVGDLDRLIRKGHFDSIKSVIDYLKDKDSDDRQSIDLSDLKRAENDSSFGALFSVLKEKFPKLTKLSARRVNLKDSDLKELSSIKGLHFLDLSYAAVSNSGAKYLSALTQMKTLSLAGTSLTKSALPYFSGMSDLVELDIGRTKIKSQEFQDWVWQLAQSDEDNAFAQYYAGLMIDRKGLKNTKEDSESRFLKAAEREHPLALKRLARKYEKLGGPIHRTKAIDYYRRSASKGNAEAEEKWFDLQKSSNGTYIGESPLGMHKSAVANHLKGLESEKLLPGLAREVYEEKDQAEFLPSQVRLAKLHLERKLGQDSKPRLGFKILMRLLAKSENPRVSFELAQCYENGQGTSADMRKAVAYYQRAAEQGYLKAQRWLGLHLGEDVLGTQTKNSVLIESKKDIILKRMQWLQRAADQGDTSALRELDHIDQGRYKSLGFRPNGRYSSRSHKSQN